jgi:polysaccharide pyruvyl transferase WcaK-like protein
MTTRTADRLPGPVLVVGAYGYRNVGDEAILAGLLVKLRRPDVTVVSRDPEATSRMHGVPAIGLVGTGAALLRHRSIVIGGGGLFGRDMGSIGRLLPLFGLSALALGRRLVVDGVDVDSDLSPTARRLVPGLLRRASDVTVRDRGSAALLDGWGVRAEVEPDLSHWMPMAAADDGRKLLREAGIDARFPVVGIALAGVRPHFADAALAAVARAMVALPDTQFCFFPLSRHPHVPAHDDLRLARRLREARPRLAIVEGEHHPAVVLSAFAQLSAVVSMRYHGMLFAERAGVPLVPLVYAEKNMRWLDEHGLVAVHAEPEALVAALQAALAGADRAAPHPVRVAS